MFSIMKNKLTILPVLATFFVMGFCDVIGIATSYIKDESALSERSSLVLSRQCSFCSFCYTPIRVCS